MSQEPNHINLYPELDDELDAAYEQAAQAERPVVGVAAVAAVAIGEANIIDEHLPLPECQPRVAAAFNRAYEQTEQLIAPLRIKMPSGNRLTNGEIDYGKLEKAYLGLESLGAKPELVFAPMLEPDDWQAFYDSRRAEPGSAFKELVINRTVREQWQTLNASQTTIDSDADDTQWQLMVMPGGPAPLLQEVDFHGSSYDPAVEPSQKMRAYYDTLQTMGVSPGFLYTHVEPNPTMNAYLTLMARKMEFEKAGFDEDSITWLRGRVDNGPNGNDAVPFGQAIGEKVQIIPIAPYFTGHGVGYGMRPVVEA